MAAHRFGRGGGVEQVTQNIRIDEIVHFFIGVYEFQVVQIESFQAYILVGRPTEGGDGYEPMKRIQTDWHSLCLGGHGEIRLYNSRRDAFADALIYCRGMDYKHDSAS